jgi:hypothetical protein
MVSALPTESFDANFEGQYLETTYFDTKDFDLFKARYKGKKKYLTIRIRCYSPPYTPGSPRQYGDEAYALSVKTDDQKFRVALATTLAESMLGSSSYDFSDVLPADLVARLLDLGDAVLQQAVTICCRRYAVENDKQRLTLDTDIRASNGKRYPANVLEYKSTRDEPPPLVICGSPIKLSKFLWSLRR